MQFDHHKNFHNSINSRLRSGITPALFELDALRGDEMLLRTRTGAALREATATQSKVRRTKFRKAIRLFCHSLHCSSLLKNTARFDFGRNYKRYAA